MKKLAMPTLDNCRLWDAIVNNKTKNRAELQALRERVLLRYGSYAMCFTSLESILPEEWSDEAKEALKSCYGDNVSFRNAKKELMQNVARCPYCLLNTPNMLDHYFDKSDYPEYSVYAPNLVPCCSECNSQKGTRVFDENGARQFVHFYCDDMPGEQLLFVRFECTDTHLIPEIKIFLECENDIIKAHFIGLKLEERYRSAISDRLTPIISEITQLWQGGCDRNEIKELLGIKHNSLAAHYGNNFWEACIYEGLLNSEEYFNSIFC